jgi:VanZ family protein
MKFLSRALLVLLLIASVYFSLKQSTEDIPDIFAADKVVHLFAYFTLVLTLDFSYKSGHVLIWKAILVIIYSAMIELAQDYVPGRDASMLDVVANVSGVFLYLLCAPLLTRHGVYKKLLL